MNRKIAVTGTKGKTTVVRLLDFVFQGKGGPVLRVDTSGAYLNGEMKVSEKESREKWGFASTNAPGRFLYLLDETPSTAILECTLFCANEGVGLGYKNHDIAIFTNVFEDHLGGKEDLKTKDDIARKKSIVFKTIAPNGFAIYNLDDPMVVGQLDKIPAGQNITNIGVTLDETKRSEDTICRVTSESIRIERSGEVIVRHELSKFSWLAPAHTPSLYSLGFVYAALYASFDTESFESAIEPLAGYSYDPDGGRMVEIVTKGGPKVILDFAHEKYSLRALAEYARTLAETDGKVIGVVRLAPSRTDELIDDTAHFIAGNFDSFIVYDKVDGYWRKPGLVKGFVDKYEEVGRVATRLSDGLRKYNPQVKTEFREDEAIAQAVSESKPGDVIVYIVNDDSKRSREFLNNALQQKGWLS